MKHLQEKLRLREANLEERENHVKQKEEFLNTKEDELLKKERDLYQQYDDKMAEIKEKESLVNEILKKHDLPLIKGDLLKALLALERTSQGTTGTYASVRGSFSNQLKDSKVCSADSFSPLKSGGCLSSQKDHRFL